MTFEEWWEAEIATRDKWVKEIAQAAWEAGWAEGLAEGYDAGYKDNGLCPNCLEENNESN